MPPEILELIGPLVAITTIGTMILIGMKMRLTARAQGSSRIDRDELSRLGDAVEGLHEEVRVMRDEFAEVQDRVDFAERLLSRGQAKEPPERISTPV